MGLTREKAYHYVDPERREEHLRWLADAGINVSYLSPQGFLRLSQAVSCVTAVPDVDDR
jgi:hypothetical protein